MRPSSLKAGSVPAQEQIQKHKIIHSEQKGLVLTEHHMLTEDWLQSIITIITNKKSAEIISCEVTRAVILRNTFFTTLAEFSVLTYSLMLC